jgi:hypothetical protein
MKFVVIGTVRPTATPRIIYEAMRRYANWKPPADLKITSSFSAVDHNRTFQVVETENGNSIYEAAMTFADCLQFEVVPVQDTAQAVPAALKYYGQTADRSE